MLVGCSSSDKALELGYVLTQDEFKDFKRYSMPRAGNLEGGNALSFNTVELEIYAAIENKKIGLALAIILTDDSWVFIQSGKSLILMVDGEKVHLSSPRGSANFRKVIGRRIKEEAHYPITTEQIKKLAYAKEIKIRIYGSNGYVSRQFNQEYFASVKGFYEKFILKNGIKTISK